MKKNLIPNFLKPGDTITIIATARKVSNTEIEPAIEFLKQQDFKVILSKNVDREYLYNKIKRT
jgi:muramoyltetrapeptide carboxypeptidase LdcA involved in peptidoglycan recycling